MRQHRGCNTKIVFKTSMFPTGEHKKTAGLLIPAVLYHSLFRTYNILWIYNTLWGEACQIKIVFEHTYLQLPLPGSGGLPGSEGLPGSLRYG